MKRVRCEKEQTATLLLDLTRLFVWLHYYNIYLIETKGQQSGRPEEEVIPCNIDVLSWNLYLKVRKQE